MGTRELIRVRKIVLALPGVNERLSHGEPCFFVRDHRPLCYYHEDHNSDGRICCGALPHLVCKRNWSPPNQIGSSLRRHQRGPHSQIGWACSSMHQMKTELIGKRSPPFSKTPSATWHPKRSSPSLTRDEQ